MLEALQAAWDWCWSGLVWVGAWLWGLLLDLFGSLVPPEALPSFAPLAYWFRVANYYIPLDLAGILFGAWISLRVGVYVLRHVVKLIPTVG